MAKYLVSTVETYRVDSENEATRTIEEAKNNGSYVLGKYTSEHRETKSKGEIVDEYWKVTLTKLFNNIKEPDTPVVINYEVEQ